jgi:hypothetical protein
MGIFQERWRIASREIKTSMLAPNRRQLDKYGDFVFNLLTAALLALIATVWRSEWTFGTVFNAGCLVIAMVVLFVLGALALKGE